MTFQKKVLPTNERQNEMSLDSINERYKGDYLNNNTKYSGGGGSSLVQVREDKTPDER